MIIFNEKEYIEQNYLKKDFCIKTLEELDAIIRYYIYKGKAVNEVRDIIKNMNRTKMINVYLDDDYVFTGVFMKAGSRPLRVSEPIWITRYEYDFVRQVGEPEKEKILFALIVIKKILGVDSTYLSLKDLKKFSMTSRAQNTLHKAIGELEQDGFISIYDGKRYRVNIDRLQAMKSENYLCIDDFDRMTVPYLKTLKTTDGFYCENCGRKVSYKKEDVKSHKKRKYCEKCAVKIKNGSKK